MAIIAVFLLSLTYTGFGAIASLKDELLAAISMKILGTSAGIIVFIIIALACLTTAIALITAFTDFIQREIFKEKISYEFILIGSLILTFFASTFKFTGISAFLWPILQFFYPGLILLTLLNIAHCLTGLKVIKFPVFFTFFSLLYFIIQKYKIAI